MNETPEDEKEYPHWNRVYVIVAVYTIVLILLIWDFSRMFQ
jgi:hypothetical protein